MKDKLIIKNFGPVKEAEIELKKVNIFIGPQGSGKSTIAKVINAVMSDVKNRETDPANTQLREKLMDDMNLSNCFERDSQVIIKNAKGDALLISKDENTFMLAEEPAAVYQSTSNAMYIPAERTVIPLIAGASFFFIREKTPIPKYVTDFGLLFQKARTDIKSQKFDFLDEIIYHYSDGRDTIELKNGKVIALNESSNGMQTTIPLLLALSWLTSKINNRISNKNIYISIEEPELSLFPVTQNDLLKFIFEKIVPLDYHLTITTHSPYTLTAINNFIYAWQVGNTNADVQQIIPRELWLNPDDVGAWFVENGTVRSIMDSETKQIKAEEIDKVSEVLNNEYDRIMDIKFK